MTRRSPLPEDPPLDWALYYQSIGWTLSHFAPGTKGPTGKGWNTAAEWIDTGAKVRTQWGATPTHGMGLIHGPSGTCAIDIDAIEPTRLIFQEFGLDLDALLADAPRIIGKRSGRDKAIFRAPEGEPLQMHKAAWRHPSDPAQNLTLFELRSGPVHDVLPPSVHPDGHRYAWRKAPWDLATIPRVPDALLTLWREWSTLLPEIQALAPWAPPRVFPVRATPASVHQDVIGAFNRAHTADGLLQAHGYARKGRRYLAPSSQSKLPGVNVLPDGRVYSHHASDILNDGHAHDAFDLFCLFEYGGDVAQAVSAAGTLLAMPLEGTTAPMLDFDALIHQGEGRRIGVPLTAPRFPASCLEVPGLVGEILAYINRTARYPQPILALGAAIAAAGTLMGRKVRTESDLRTNIYVLAVADAGAGKEHARQALRKLFEFAGCYERVAVEGLASEASILTALAARPSSLFLLDEIGRFLQVVNDPRAPSHLAEVISQLLKLHSAATGPYSGKVYADAERNQVLQQPNLSIYGTTVPSTLHAALTPGQIEDGFLSRILVFESETPDPLPVNVTSAPPPQALIDMCAWWERLPESHEPGGNVDAALRPSPRILPPSPEARLRFERFETEMRERRAKLRAQGKPTALYVRTAATAQRLGLIRAAGCMRDEPVITGADAEWGCQLALFLADSLAYRVLRNVAENLIERNLQRVGRLIEQAGARGLTKNELTRRTQWLRANERNEIVATLLQGGTIIVAADKNEGRGPTSQRLVWHGEEDEPQNSSTRQNSSIDEFSEVTSGATMT